MTVATEDPVNSKTLSITDIFFGRESIYLLESIDSYNSVRAEFLQTNGYLEPNK